jgi:hypothetical protein
MTEGIQNAFTVVVGKHEDMRSLGSQKGVQEDNIEMDIKEVSGEGVK